MNYGRVIVDLLVDKRSMKDVLDMFNLKVEGDFVEIDGEKYPLENVEVKINYCEDDEDGFIVMNIEEEGDKE